MFAYQTVRRIIFICATSGYTTSALAEKLAKGEAAMLRICGTIFVLSALALAGCTSSAPEESGSDPLSLETPRSPASIGTATQAIAEFVCGSMTFEDYLSWTRVNDDLLHSEGHSNSWVDIFVNDLAEDTYLSAAAPYAVCSAVVKPTYAGENRERVAGVGAMVKMPAGYDPDNGDWWYGRFDATGKYAIKQGILEDCIVCHSTAAEADYMFSKQVLQSTSD
jgi:hypothetical protein